MYQSIVDTPADIYSLLKDLKVLSSALADIASTAQQQGQGSLGFSGQTFVEAIEFEADSKLTRRWNAIKVAYKKDTLKGFRDQLEEAKSTLLVALHGYQSRSIQWHAEQEGQKLTRVTNDLLRLNIGQQNHHTLIKELSDRLVEAQVEISVNSALTRASMGDIKSQLTALEAKILGMAAQNMCGVPMLSLMDTLRDDIRRLENSGSSGTYSASQSLAHPIYHLPIKAYSHVYQALNERFFEYYSLPRSNDEMTATKEGTEAIDEDNDVRMESLNTVIFHPAVWLRRFGLKYGLQLTSAYVQKRWKYMFEPFRAVPYDALIFKFCTDRKLGAVRELLSRGEVSVRDTGPDGWTPLHCAVAGGNVELSKFLITSGAGKTACEYILAPPPALFVNCVPGIKPELIRLFEDQIDFLDSTSSGWTLFKNLFFDGRLSHYRLPEWLLLIHIYREDIIANIDPESVRHWTTKEVYDEDVDGDNILDHFESKSDTKIGTDYSPVSEQRRQS
ncbi:hypothetical protein AJ80_08949 [Polytolypa hystricis UAMH7299]|uniref:Uncharacterized protein n=1 Tax=Polytolypa hystricis (strain UAMH7299) TaxID=1447883 RepID=A0A2B7WZ81_POLH7|nr:hypothetical protein AJ80_08949 [Polytolypa hystricis UAMH7299]